MASEVWLPASLLPSRSRRRIEEARRHADESQQIVAWTLHVRDIAAAALPAQGHFLCFTAVWSHESKRTSVARPPGSHSWSARWPGAHSWVGEHASLALPHEIDHDVRDVEIEVRLCETGKKQSDEVVSSTIVKLSGRSGRVERLPLGDDALHPKAAVPAVSFRFDIVGLTPAQHARAAGAAAAAEDVGLPLSAPQSGAPSAPALRGVSALGASASTNAMPSVRPSHATCSPRGALGTSASSAALHSTEEGASAREETATSAPDASQLTWAEAPIRPRTHPARAPPAADLPTSFAFGTAIPPPPARVRLKPPPGLPSTETQSPATTALAPKMPPTTRANSRAAPPPVPSARLLAQLDECMRIKAAFKRAGLRCPTQAIEHGLLLPDDAPDAACREVLPWPGGYAPPPGGALKGKAKGNKKGKGGKKGGKKKK